jgi:hypothetical protein
MKPSCNHLVAAAAVVLSVVAAVLHLTDVVMRGASGGWTV